MPNAGPGEPHHAASMPAAAMRLRAGYDKPVDMRCRRACGIAVGPASRWHATRPDAKQALVPVLPRRPFESLVVGVKRTNIVGMNQPHEKFLSARPSGSVLAAVPPWLPRRFPASGARIDRYRFFLPDPEELGIKVADVIEVRAPFAVGASGHAGFGVVVSVDVPAVGGDLRPDRRPAATPPTTDQEMTPPAAGTPYQYSYRRNTCPHPRSCSPTHGSPAAYRRISVQVDRTVPTDPHVKRR